GEPHIPVRARGDAGRIPSIGRGVFGDRAVGCDACDLLPVELAEPYVAVRAGGEARWVGGGRGNRKFAKAKALRDATDAICYVFPEPEVAVRTKGHPTGAAVRRRRAPLGETALPGRHRCQAVRPAAAGRARRPFRYGRARCGRGKRKRSARDRVAAPNDVTEWKGPHVIR